MLPAADIGGPASEVRNGLPTGFPLTASQTRTASPLPVRNRLPSREETTNFTSAECGTIPTSGR